MVEIRNTLYNRRIKLVFDNAQHKGVPYTVSTKMDSGIAELVQHGENSTPGVERILVLPGTEDRVIEQLCWAYQLMKVQHEYKRKDNPEC